MNTKRTPLVGAVETICRVIVHQRMLLTLDREEALAADESARPPLFKKACERYGIVAGLVMSLHALVPQEDFLSLVAELEIGEDELDEYLSALTAMNSEIGMDVGREEIGHLQSLCLDEIKNEIKTLPFLKK